MKGRPPRAKRTDTLFPYSTRCRSIAGEMPSLVIAELLGIPLEDGRTLYHLTETLHAAAASVGVEAQQAAFGQMYTYARSEEHTSELQSLMRISYAVFCLKKKTTTHLKQQTTTPTPIHTPPLI